jgi:hypothetical protein
MPGVWDTVCGIDQPPAPDHRTSPRGLDTAEPERWAGRPVEVGVWARPATMVSGTSWAATHRQSGPAWHRPDNHATHRLRTAAGPVRALTATTRGRPGPRLGSRAGPSRRWSSASPSGDHRADPGRGMSRATAGPRRARAAQATEEPDSSPRGIDDQERAEQDRDLVHGEGSGLAGRRHEGRSGRRSR